MQLDKFHGDIISEITNAYTPTTANSASGGKTTATEIIENTRRIDLFNGDRLARFYGQWCELIGMMQRRAYSRDNIKAAKDYLDEEEKDNGKPILSSEDYDALKEMRGVEEAKQYKRYDLPAHLDREAVLSCVGLLRAGLSDLDVWQIARSPANEPLGDSPDTMAKKLQAAYPLFSASPAIDQYQFLKLVLSAALSPQLADELLLPPNANDTAALAQAQKQLLELGAMAALGAPVPVLPDDSDPEHRAVLSKGFGAVPQDPAQIAVNPVQHNALTLGLNHFDAHLAAGKQKGEKGEAFDADVALSAHVRDLLGKADAIVAQQNQQQSQPPQITQ